MNVIVFGGTGFIGKELVKALGARGHQATVADTRRTPMWEQLLETADAVINLSGSPIFGRRWSDEVKSDLHSSRMESTQKIVEAMGNAHKKNGRPQVLVNASAIGYYGPAFDVELDENSPNGSDFLAFVCREWEEAARKAEMRFGIRTVMVRTGVVLGKGGGALEQMLHPFKVSFINPFKMGLGGPVGFGKQWMSWVHIDDVVGLYIHALENTTVKGPINATAPEALRNKDFTKVLARVLKRPAFFPLPSLVLYAMYGEVAEILVNGQRVLPKLAQSTGYTFKFPKLDTALRNILS